MGGLPLMLHAGR